MVSKASDDLPDPLTPVTMISFPTGSVRSIPFRLCVRAPRTTRFASPLTGAAFVSTMGVPAGCVNHHRSAAVEPRQRGGSPQRTWGVGAGKDSARQLPQQSAQLQRFIGGEDAEQLPLDPMPDIVAERARLPPFLGEDGQPRAAVAGIVRPGD